MDEISQGPRRDLRLPPGPRRWLTVAGAAGLIAAIAVFGITRAGGRHGPVASAVPTATRTEPTVAAPAPVVKVVPEVPAAPGTVLLTCDSAIWGRPDAHWKAGSLRAGPLWLVGGRQLGYARLGRRAGQAPGAPGVSAGHRGQSQYVEMLPSRYVEMLVHVDAGSTVVMRAAAGTWPAFEFLNSPGTTGDYQGLDGDRGYTFVPCPAAGARNDGTTDFYDVGFSIIPGHTASVEVLPRASGRPVWLTFTTPKGGD